jgi:hypothetical protein
MRHTEGRAPAATGGRSAPTRSRQARAGSVVARGLGDALGQGSLGNWCIGPTTVPVGLNQFEFNSNDFIPIQNYSNFIWFKQGLPWLKIFEIKYGYKGFEIWNNFPYRNIQRFKKDFELKIREASRVWIWWKKIWSLNICWNLGEMILIALGWQINSWERIWEFKFMCFLIYFKNLIWIDLNFDFVWPRIGLTTRLTLD